MPNIFVISGPSGSGKDAVIDGLAGAGVKVARVITTTSRPPRSGESEGRPYHFLSPEEFARQKNSGEFLESAYYNDFGYGSRQSDLAEATATGRSVIWRVDPQGVKSLKKLYSDAAFILIDATEAEIKNRLEKRGANTAEQIANRLKDYNVIKGQADMYNAVIQNHDGYLAEAIGELAKIINGSIQ